MPKCVLAFSGGLDTLVAISWLKERRNFDVVALSVDLGHGQGLEFAIAKGLPLPKQNGSHAYGYDLNLWGQSMELGALEDPSKPFPEEAYTLTVSPLNAPNEPEEVEIEFREGLPAGLNGKRIG